MRTRWLVAAWFVGGLVVPVAGAADTDSPKAEDTDPAKAEHTDPAEAEHTDPAEAEDTDPAEASERDSPVAAPIVPADNPNAESQTIKVRLTASEMPPTRTLCEIVVGSTAVVAEWDPSFDSRLTQTLLVPRLDDRAGNIIRPVISCWSRRPPADDAGNIPPHWVFVGDAEKREDMEAKLWEVTKLLVGKRPCDIDAARLSGDALPTKLDPEESIKHVKELAKGSLKDANARLTTTQLQLAIRAVVRTRLRMPVAIRIPADADGQSLGAEWQCFTPPDRRGTTGLAACQYDGLPTHRPTINIKVLNGSDGAQRPLAELLTSFDAQTLTISDERSFFSPAPAAVVDTLSALGDLALRRAQRRTREFVAERLGGDLCGDGVEIKPPWITTTNRLILDKKTIGYPHLGSNVPSALSDAATNLNPTTTLDSSSDVRNLLIRRESKSRPGERGQAFVIAAIYDHKTKTHRLACPNGNPVPTVRTGGLKAFIAAKHSDNDKVVCTDADSIPSLSVVESPDEADIIVHLERLGQTNGIAVLRKKRSWRSGRLVNTLDASNSGMGTLNLAFPQTCALIEGRSFADFARSGRDIAEALGSDLLHNALLAFTQFALLAPHVAPEIRHNVAPLVQSALPTIIEAARRGEPPSPVAVQTMLASFRQSLSEGATNGSQHCDPGKAWLAIGLGIVAECMEDNSCDPRTTTMKLAKPDEHFGDVVLVFPSCKSNPHVDLKNGLPLKLRESLARVVNHMYAVFDQGAGATPTQRARAAVQATFASAAFGLDFATHMNRNLTDRASDRTALDASRDLLEGIQELAVAGIDQDWTRVAQQARLVVPSLIRLAALDVTCKTNDATTSRDSRAECTRSLAHLSVALDRALPWVTTLAAHSDQIAEERSGNLSAKEVEASKESRAKALESLIESAGNRAGRNGEWVASIGTGVGFRLAGSWERAGAPLPVQPTATVGVRGGALAQTPVTLPMGLAVQFLPTTRWNRDAKPKRPLTVMRESLEAQGSMPKRQRLGAGFHLQLSAIDLGQFIIASDDIRGVTWNEFLMVGAQTGLIFGTPRDNFVLALDARYAPTVGARGAFQFGGVLTYYVPFLNLN